MVEDDSDIQEMLIHVLENQVDTIRGVRSAEAAIETCRADRPGLIVLDIGLPMASGRDLVEWLKHNGFNDIPLIVYTVSELTEQARQELKLGTTLHFNKSETPIDELADWAMSVLNGHGAANSQATGPDQ